MVMVMENYEKKKEELERAETEMRKAAAEKIGKLITGMPKWTMEGIGKEVGLSRAAISKVRARHEDIGIDPVKKILETDFRSEA